MAMRHVQRYDIGVIERVKLDKAQRTPEGYLIAPVRVARVGVLTYFDEKGNPFKELVPPDELFKSDSMQTLSMKPVTARKHPSVMLDSKNWKQFQVGMTGEKVAQDERFLTTNAIIQDADAIRDIEKGMQEASCGYVAELDMTPGEFEGERYDAIQRNRQYNHVAIVDRGRAGREARMRLDSELNQIKEENTMKFKIGDKEFDTAQEVADHISGLMQQIASLTTGKADSDAKLAQANTSMAAMKADADKVPGLVAEVAKQTGRADAAEAKVKELQDPAKFNDAVKSRMGLIERAKPVLDKETVEKIDSMSDIEIKKAVILSRNKDMKFEGKDDAFVSAYFEGLMGSPVSNNDDDGGIGKGIQGAREDAAGTGGKKKDADGCNGEGGNKPLNKRWQDRLPVE